MRYRERGLQAGHPHCWKEPAGAAAAPGAALYATPPTCGADCMGRWQQPASQKHTGMGVTTVVYHCYRCQESETGAKTWCSICAAAAAAHGGAACQWGPSLLVNR